jgi:hypothetical protein
MTELAERLDIVIQKGARFYQEFQQVDDNGAPIPIVNQTIKCIMKESFKSTVNLFELTEENGGIILDDAANGVFGLLLNANQTDIPQTIGIYDVLLIDNDYPALDSDRIVEGKIRFSPGITKQVTADPVINPTLTAATEITITDNYTVAADKSTVFVRAFKSISIILPPPVKYREVWIKDIGGNAGTYPITVVGAIDGVTNYVIGSNYGGATFTWNGVEWSVKA